MASGICNAVYPCDRAGVVSTPPLAPNAPDAVSIYFEINSTITTPPQDQLDLKRDIERMLHAIGRLFSKKQAMDDAGFRPYYVQLVRLAQLGLAGPNASPDIARRALEGVTAELIDDQGAIVKNGHLKRLAGWGSVFAIFCSVLYVILRFMEPTGPIAQFLSRLGVDARVLSCFMLLWVGCFVGVVLSYGARTTTMTLSDLVNTDADRLLPQVRLLFAGTLTMVIGLFLYLAVIEFKIGSSISSNQIGDSAMIAFLVGVLCGLSELSLPGAVTKKATSLLDLK